MKRTELTQVIRREDYQPSPWWIETVDLTFDLDPAKTRVLNKMTLRRNPQVPAGPLRLDGEDLNLARVLVNGQGASFRIESDQLVLDLPPDGEDVVAIEIFTTCQPIKNTQLMGLYVSNGSFFTQCEAEGFRRITYFLDRPDVMALYTVTLRADKAQYPVLLSNGNLVDQGLLDDGRHFARWVDPHKKPCYLFALVAGNFVCREQKILSRSGTAHLLQIYVRQGDLEKTEHAMRSLMASVAWDEARFNLPLDLERFMIVATSDFNMGAMENKGLNIFNTKFVLASPATATDADFANVESVVGHEYFHNWTGNRVTCRDWFQLSLKEGLTVFRDQEFSQDLAHTPSARAVKRIEDVRLLRTVQFAEDAGPMAHPVRPDSYLEINNFYTVTIYEKGAEVVRMMQTLVGREGFAQGMALYFQRHDGQAVTCDDFAQAIADANPQSALAHHLNEFKRWYSQSGTPRVTATGAYDAASGHYMLSLRQHCLPTPGQDQKQPFVIPVTMGLIGQDGAVLPCQLAGDHPGVTLMPAANQGLTVVLTQELTTLNFIGLAVEPVPSLLRGFSAPVILESNLTLEQQYTLLAHDCDPFNRWEAAQCLSLDIAITLLKRNEALPATGVLPEAFVSAMRAVLLDEQLDASFKELVLTLPFEDYIADQLQEADPQRIHAVREAMRAELAIQLACEWAATYEQLRSSDELSGPYAPTPQAMGKRALAALALGYLCLAAKADGQVEAAQGLARIWPQKAMKQFQQAANMTDRLSALLALVNTGHELAKPALIKYFELYKNEPLAMDKWFALQAGACDQQGHVLPVVRQLTLHPDFNLRNPNRARSLVFSYCNFNPAAFHRVDAGGYVFWGEKVIELDTINPQVAARLARALDRWKRLSEPYRSAAHEALRRVAAKADLSNDVREVVQRALHD